MTENQHLTTRFQHARLDRYLLDVSCEPSHVALHLQAEDRPFWLSGVWGNSRAILSSQPIAVASATEDPFELLGVQGAAAITGERPGPTAAIGGGWFGYLGYQLGGRIELLPPSPPRPAPLPPASLAFYDHVITRDQQGRWWFEALHTPERAAFLERRRHELERRLQTPAPELEFRADEFRLARPADAHLEAVRECVEQIRAGEIFQANICLRLESSYVGHPLAAFVRACEDLRPPYGAYFEGPWGAIVSLSPELFVRRVADRVETAPIKGTVKRSSDSAQATQARRNLEASSKNKAENVMIVDLMRSDLSRVCEPGSVVVDALCDVESHPGVWHLVSRVTGKPMAGVGDGDLVRALFPPGSVTGAPKVRALEIITDLEATARDVYTGAIGFVSPTWGAEFNVAIRTFELRDGEISLGVGGGIVAESEPEAELDECFVKARPLLQSLGSDIADLPATAQAVSPALDRAVFETILVVGGYPVEMWAHLRRLGDAVHRLFGKTLPPRLARQIEIAAAQPFGAADSTQEAILRVFAHCGRAGLVLRVTCELRGSHDHSGPVVLDPREMRGGWGEFKWKEREDLEHPRADLEYLLVDGGQVLESERANLFVVRDGVVTTPPLDGRILAGITRSRILKLAAFTGYETSETALTLDDLNESSEVFLTSSISGVRPVAGLRAGPSWDPGPVTAQLDFAWQQWSHRTYVAERARSHQLRTKLAPAASVARTHRANVRVDPGQEVFVVIDNYDSFTFNLVHYLAELGLNLQVVRSLEMSVEEVLALDATGIVISPGPSAPANAGISLELIRALGGATPVLGVCLGHQCIAEAYGAIVEPASQVVHGKVSEIHHDRQGVMAGLPNPIVATRYHSLIVRRGSAPPELTVTAHTSEGVIMGVRHIDHPVEGVQFHPESVLTEHGKTIVSNFVRGARAHRADMPVR